jgi:hypothetical protein
LIQRVHAHSVAADVSPMTRDSSAATKKRCLGQAASFTASATVGNALIFRRPAQSVARPV